MSERPGALRTNAGQLAVLVALTALVGAMVGVERSLLPLVGERDFSLSSNSVIVSFVVAFGAGKACADLLAGVLAERIGRRPVLLAGWLAMLPVPALLAVASSWRTVVLANVLLGAGQGIAWTTTVLMKIDRAAPSRRGTVIGLNETAGYLGVAAAAFATGVAAGAAAPRTVLWVGAAAVAVAGAACALLAVDETRPPRGAVAPAARGGSSRRGVAAAAQAGFATNLNDGLAWGLGPLYVAAAGASTRQVAVVAAVYPAVWGAGQLPVGWVSDRVGRTRLIVAGMLGQAGALAVLAAGGGRFGVSLAAATLLGAGTALVYPTLLAAVADAAPAQSRGRAVGTYRFWRDAGLVAGALLAGAAADAAGMRAAIVLTAVAAAGSAAWVAAAARPRPGSAAAMGPIGRPA